MKRIKNFTEFYQKAEKSIVDQGNQIREEGKSIGISRIDGNEIFLWRGDPYKVKMFAGKPASIERVAKLEQMIQSYDLVAEPGFLAHLDEDMPNQNLGYPTSKLPSIHEFVREFQRSHGLTADGIVGHKTNRAAESKYDWMTNYASTHSLNE